MCYAGRSGVAAALMWTAPAEPSPTLARPGDGTCSEPAAVSRNVEGRTLRWLGRLQRTHHARRPMEPCALLGYGLNIAWEVRMIAGKLVSAAAITLAFSCHGEGPTSPTIEQANRFRVHGFAAASSSVTVSAGISCPFQGPYFLNDEIVYWDVMTGGGLVTGPFVTTTPNPPVVGTYITGILVREWGSSGTRVRSCRGLASIVTLAYIKHSSCGGGTRETQEAVSSTMGGALQRPIHSISPTPDLTGSKPSTRRSSHTIQLTYT